MRPTTSQSPRLTSAITPASASVLTTPAFQGAVRRVRAGKPLTHPLRRVATAAQMGSFIKELLAEHDVAFARLVRRVRGTIPTERIINVLRDASQQPTKTEFDDAQAIADLVEVVRRAVGRQAPLPLVLLLGGDKAPSALKTGRYSLPDAAELIAMVRLGALAAALNELHPSGVTVLPVPDAQLHTSDIGTSAASASAHQCALRRWSQRLGVADRVQFPDTLSLLPADWLGQMADELAHRSDREVHISSHRGERR